MKRIFFLTSLLFNLCLLTGMCLSQENLVGTRENILTFADYLFEQEDYYRAATEYKRVVFMSAQEEKNIPQVKFKIGLCYQKSRKWDVALANFKQLKKEFPAKLESIDFEIGRTYYLKENYYNALEVFQGLLESNKLSDYSQYMIGWCHLRQMDWPGAELAFSQVKADGTDLHAFSRDLARYSEHGAKLSHRSPLIAGIISTLIPGGGQIYLQRFGDGIFSMIAIFGTAYLSNHYYQENHKTTAYILGGLSATFYAGNIYGATASARLINISLKSHYLEEIDKTASEKGVTIEVW
ncbi:MAG: tetratricopeptide repeat protein [bacterium]|nr:tetratricopeptide repeat protein [bacterium]